MSETIQNDAPSKRCGHTFRDDIDCVRPLGHPNACVQKEAWCDKHCAYMHWTERDGKPWIYICLACVLESVQQLRCSIEAIDKKNLPQLMDNAFYRLDGLKTNVENIDRVLGGEKTCRLSESIMIATRQALAQAAEPLRAELGLHRRDIDDLTGLTNRRIEAILPHIETLRGELATLRKETQEDSAELRQLFAYRNVRAEKTWRERAREFIGLQLRELAYRLDGQP